MKYFIKRKKGHIVGTSSIASLRGNPLSPAYRASKAFISNYMEGLRLMAYKNNLEITITDIRPGVIDADMTKDYRSFVKEPVSLAANQIFFAIKHKKKKVYIPRKWAFFIAIFYKIFPEKIYNCFRKILLR